MQEVGTRTTTGKALTINLDAERYGTFAEIGAGQEVARYFFQAGKASQTIAKTISAYDMIYSDEIYGKEKSGRYVCESRVNKMLEKEFNLLVRRLDSSRGSKTAFFAFANTVSTSSAEGREPHGWMGIRFQTRPKGPFNDIVLHVRMLDKSRLIQQESLGVLGVNLCTCAFYHLRDQEEFMDHLVDNLRESQIAIDVIKLSGPDLKKLDERSINISFVQKGWSDAVLFDPQGNIANLSDSIYAKPLLIQRGNFRPVTVTHLDILSKGLTQFKSELKSWAGNKAKPEDILQIMEMTMNSLIGEPTQAVSDFSIRVDMLNKMGYYAMVSKFKQLSDLKHHLRKYTRSPIAVVLGAIHLERLFDSKNYSEVEGGVLEGMAKLLDANTKLYVYPHKTDKICMTTRSFFPDSSVKLIYQHFLDAKQIVDISGCDEIEVYFRGSDVMEMLKAKKNDWKKQVPADLHDLAKKLIANRTKE